MEMIIKNKAIAIATILLTIGAVIGGLIFNFQEFLMGSPANIKNVIVTLLYIAIWILVLVISLKMRSRIVLKYCSVFWIVTLLPAIETIYVNATGTSAGWALPFVILFIGQWYGVTFFVGSFLTASIIIAVISLVLSTTAVISLKRTR